MRIAVIYESMYGNTAAIAEAIADALGEFGDVTLSPVAEDMSVDADMLILGGPTHAHGMSTGMSRKTIELEAQEAARRGTPLDVAPTGGIRTLLSRLPHVEGIPAAAFDTRFEKSEVLTGSAAKAIAKKLRRRGYHLVADPESFFVLDSEGPLKDDELERARAWGASLKVPVSKS